MTQPLRPTKGLLIFECLPEDLGARCSLTEELGDEDAHRLFRALRNDTIERFASLGFAHTIMFARNEEQANELKTQYALLKVMTQAGDTPAERLSYAIEDGFEAGFRQIMLLCSFLPTLPIRFVSSGFTLLDMFDDALVIGPTTRGGYYTLGMRRPLSELFDYLDFMREDVYEESLRRISATDYALYTLPNWHGLKNLEDLKKLFADSVDNASLPYTSAFFTTHSIFSLADI